MISWAPLLAAHVSMCSMRPRAADPPFSERRAVLATKTLLMVATSTPVPRKYSPRRHDENPIGVPPCQAINPHCSLRSSAIACMAARALPSQKAIYEKRLSACASLTKCRIGPRSSARPSSRTTVCSPLRDRAKADLIKRPLSTAVVVTIDTSPHSRCQKPGTLGLSPYQWRARTLRMSRKIELYMDEAGHVQWDSTQEKVYHLLALFSGLLR